MKHQYKISNLLVEIEFLKKKLSEYQISDSHTHLVRYAIQKQIIKIENQIIDLGNRL